MAIGWGVFLGLATLPVVAAEVRVNGKGVGGEKYLPKETLSIEVVGAGEDWQWEYGDGAMGRGWINTHAYERAGQYDLKVFGGEELRAEETVKIVPFSGYFLPGVQPAVNGVVGRDVEADFSEILIFEARQATGSARLVEYRWDFADGAIVEGRLVKRKFPPTIFDADIKVWAKDEYGFTTQKEMTVVNKTVGPKLVESKPNWPIILAIGLIVFGCLLTTKCITNKMN